MPTGRGCKIKCLIDADVLLHEIGWSGQFRDKETGEDVLLPFEEVSKLLDDKIKVIEYDCEATEPSALFITESEKLVEMWNKTVPYTDRELLTYTKNFRYGVATTKPYKGTRKNPKPVHFYNVAAYMMSNYDVVVSQDGLEADDELAIRQMGSEEGTTVICSRDKDLRITTGWHYSWECGKQSSMGPTLTDELGWLGLKPNKDVYGYGLKFFFFQMLCGDSADNIPGLPKYGKVAAYKNILDCKDKSECLSVVKDLYKESLGERSRDYFMEQANLLWIRQYRDTPFNLKDI